MSQKVGKVSKRLLILALFSKKYSFISELFLKLFRQN